LKSSLPPRGIAGRNHLIKIINRKHGLCCDLNALLRNWFRALKQKDIVHGPGGHRLMQINPPQIMAGVAIQPLSAPGHDHEIATAAPSATPMLADSRNREENYPFQK
jgi:hypothetical protein